MGHDPSAQERARAAELLLSSGGGPHSLAEGALARPGAESLGWMVRTLRAVLDADFVFVGELAGEILERVHSVAVDVRAGPSEPFEYSLAGTPCEDVVKQSACIHARDVVRHFPDDALLAAMAVESYVGTPLHNDQGQVVGLLVALWKRPLTAPESALATLELFAPRAGAELGQRQAARQLELVVETIAADPADDVFRTLARALYRALRLRVTFVSEILDEQMTRARTVALCRDGVLIDDFEYALDDTPCKVLYERGTLVHPRGLRELYPRDEFLHQMGAESYIGMVCFDANRVPCGHVGAIHDAPLPDDFRSEQLLHVLASRASAELQRRRSESRRKAVEQRLYEAQKMESLGLLAGGIAHDFNNLLVAILGNANLASSGLPAGSTVRSHLAGIETACERAADLARQLLAYSGHGRFVVQPIDLSELVRETSQLLAVTIPKHVKVRQELAEGLPATLADPTQIRQVLMNLVLNAVEAIGAERGEIRLATSLRRVGRAELDGLSIGRELKEGEYVQLSVVDTGAGMDAATQARIFDPLFTTKRAGRGLGLAAVLGIVRGHAGGLRVTSTVGRGSAFDLLLPCTAGPAARSDPSEASSPEWRGTGLVLVADDDELARQTTARIVEHVGFTVTVAADGAAAIEAVRRHGRELRAVLLDLTMPGLSGEEVVRQIRELRPRVPIILMSGYDELETAARFAEQVLAGFLHKPFRMRDAADALRQAVSGSERARPDVIRPRGKPTRRREV